MPPPVAVPWVQEVSAIYSVRAKPLRAAAEAASSADNPVRVHSRNLAEFAVHGAKYAFAADRLPVAVGVPTSHSAPFAAMQDAKLYDMLALFDALRVGARHGAQAAAAVDSR